MKAKKTLSVRVIYRSAFIIHPFATARARGGRRGIRAIWRRESSSGRRHVVLDAAQFDQVVGQIENDVSGFRVAVAGLADGAGVDEVFAADLDFDLAVHAALDALLVADEGDGQVGVTVETDRGVLVGDAGGSREFVEHVRPFLRQVERGVDDGEWIDNPDVFQVAEPAGRLPSVGCEST